MAKKKQTAKLSFDVDRFLTSVDGGRTVSQYRKNQIVFSQGEPADSVFYVQAGKVKITVLSDRGKEAVVALLKEGDFLGEGSLTGQPLRLATAKSMGDSTILRMSKASIVRVLADEPAFA